MTRPEFCTDEMLEFLDDLRESGATNMFGASAFLLGEFPDEFGETQRAKREQVKAVVMYWMETFGKEDR